MEWENDMIRDFEDKKLTLCYFMSRQHDPNKFSLNQIYFVWANRQWKQDFKFDGKAFKLKDSKLLPPKSKKLSEEELNKMADEYTKILKEVQTYFQNNYDTKISRKRNSEKFRDMKFDYCYKKHKELQKLFLVSGIDLEDRYAVYNKTSKHHPNHIGRYEIFDKQRRKTMILGSFEDVRDYINAWKERLDDTN